jgi:aerobic-type carbon monoxide dehydrogenase small subunit (CoxS/CutS family)
VYFYRAPVLRLTDHFDPTYGSAFGESADRRCSCGDCSEPATINGQPHEILLDPRVTLLDPLREHLQLTGTKKGCDHEQCGACTVLVNGRRINSCLSLAVVHEGDEITTIEGVANGNDLHPMQAAFLESVASNAGTALLGRFARP